MTGFSLWWAKNKGWGLPVLLLVLVALVLTLSQSASYFVNKGKQNKIKQQTNQTLEANAVRKEADVKKQRNADSLIHTLAGEQKEQTRATKKSRIEYEKATADLPAITELPRHPPRFVPGGR